MGLDLALGLFLLFAGGYLLVAGIRGKGGVYINNNIKEGCEGRYRRTVRICCFAVSLPLISAFVFAFLRYGMGIGVLWTALDADEANALFSRLDLCSSIARWVSLGGVVAMIALTMNMSNKAANEAADTEITAKKHPAFDFDDADDDSDDSNN